MPQKLPKVAMEQLPKYKEQLQPQYLYDNYFQKFLFSLLPPIYFIWNTKIIAKNSVDNYQVPLKICQLTRAFLLFIPSLFSFLYVINIYRHIFIISIHIF